MAWAVDQASLGTIGDSSGFGGTTVTLTTSSTAASNTWIFACVTWMDLVSATGTCTLSGGSLSWTTTQGFSGDFGGSIFGGAAVCRAFAAGGLASSTVLTATFSSGNTANRLIGAQSFTGGDSASFDKDGAVSASLTTVATWVGGTIATATDNELLITSCSAPNGAASTPSGSTVESFESAPGSGGNSFNGSRLIAGTAGNFATGGGWNFNDQYVAISVAMKIASGATTYQKTGENTPGALISGVDEYPSPSNAPEVLRVVRSGAVWR